jgi:hypothetical protein
MANDIPNDSRSHRPDGDVGRSVIERQERERELARLRKELVAAERTIVGLGSLIAKAHAAGFVVAVAPKDDAG